MVQRRCSSKNYTGCGEPLPPGHQPKAAEYGLSLAGWQLDRIPRRCNPLDSANPATSLIESYVNVTPPDARFIVLTIVGTTYLMARRRTFHGKRVLVGLNFSNPA